MYNEINFNLIADVINSCRNLPNIHCSRQELCADLCNALKKAHIDKMKVSKAMRNLRDHKRVVGRHANSKSLGTTLLSKGLEFDVVIIYEAHNFKCPKNFYVALTRASKRLIIFTNNNKLNPYPDNGI